MSLGYHDDRNIIIWVLTFLNCMQGRVLEPLGAVTTGSQFLEPDGKFMCPDYQSSGCTLCQFTDEYLLFRYVHIQGKTPRT